jgi:hypothetical protein
VSSYALYPENASVSFRIIYKMKSDVGRRGFAFVSGMTFPFDMAILNIKLKWKT